MATTFTAGGNGIIQPATAQRIIIRSTSAADTTQTGTIRFPGGTGLATLAGKLERDTNAEITTLNQVTLSAATAGTITVLGQGTAAIGDVRFDTNPANGTSITVGVTGHTKTYIFRTALTVPSTANEVLIGATTSDTAENFRQALWLGQDERDDSLNSGVKYFVSGFHYEIEPTRSTNVVTLTDTLGVARQLGWTLTQSSTHLSLRTLVGGVDGALLGTINIGALSATRFMTFDTESLTTLTLFANSIPTTDLINFGSGRDVMLWMSSAAPGAITLKYQVTVDGVVWRDGATALTSLTNGSAFATKLAERIERIRLVILTNANTAADVAVNLKAV